MLLLCHKHFVLSFLLIILVLFEAQTSPIDHPDFDQALHPFGSKAAVRGTFMGRCIENDDGATFIVRSNCPFTVWAASVPSGGQRLDTDESWNLKLPSGATGRVWGRTNCTFDTSERGHCETGDCGGVLHCQGPGAPPNTLLNFALNQYNKQDFYSLSLVQGFNIPVEIVPMSDGCGAQRVRCAADINGHCPPELRAAGGCKDPCTVFGTTQYCCNNSSTICEPTSLSKFFKTMCPRAYSYPNDDETNKFTCLGKTNYHVVFCPL